MKESQFGFEYSWDDLRPVRPLYVTILVAQLLGFFAGLFFGHGDWFERAFVWAALATFLGYLLGLWVQAVMLPGSLGRNPVLVRRLGLLAAFFGVFALTFPLLA
jgi:Na+/H+-dicarboxylate symporter